MEVHVRVHDVHVRPSRFAARSRPSPLLSSTPESTRLSLFCPAFERSMIKNIYKPFTAAYKVFHFTSLATDNKMSRDVEFAAL